MDIYINKSCTWLNVNIKVKRSVVLECREVGDGLP